MKKKSKFILFICCIVAILVLICGFIIKKTSINKGKKVSTEATQVSNDNTTQPTKETIAKKEEKAKNKFDGIKLTASDIGIPVLCYHDVTPNNPDNNDMLLNPNKFKEQLKWLKENGYTSITLTDLYNHLRNNESIPEKPVVLTFDDGYRGNFTYAYPILNEMGFTANFFVISDFVDNGLYMTKDELKELVINGFEVDSHTSRHLDLSKLNYNQQVETFKTSREALEKIINKPVNFVAYPYGKYNAETRNAAETAGYKLGFNLCGNLADRNDNNYNMDRLYVSNNYSLEHFANKIKNATK